jgi:hypothetical protein
VTFILTVLIALMFLQVIQEKVSLGGKKPSGPMRKYQRVSGGNPAGQRPSGPMRTNHPVSGGDLVENRSKI